MPAAALHRLQIESLPLVVLCAFAAILATKLPALVAPDTWLALVGGREILQHGLPQHDTLTVWSGGAEWVNQQWLAHLLLYSFVAVGGLPLALAVQVAMLVAALALAMITARRLGASPRSTALGGAAFLLAGGAENVLRAQTLAVPLFALLLWLLLSDVRSPSNRVLVCIPLIAVWGNLHGSAVLAAGLVALRGLDSLRARPGPGVALLGGSIAALAATPYGLSVVGYYARTLGNPSFSEYVTEWRAPALPAASGLVLVIFATVVLATRHTALLARYEVVVFGVLVIAALSANRHAVWLALLTAMLLPRFIDGAWPARSIAPPGRASSAALIAGGTLLTLVIATASTRGPAWYEEGYPANAATSVARIVRTEPDARVLTNDLYADWLLWRVPEARGRVAFDVRFELLSRVQLERIRDFRTAREGWRDTLRGYRVVVLDSRTQTRQSETLLAEGRAEPLFRDERLAVLLLRGSG